jgi:hypothetical protein
MRDPQLSGGICLADAAHRRERDCRPIRLRKAIDHRRQAGRQFGLGGAIAGRIRNGRQFLVALDGVVPAVPAEACPQGIPQRVAGNLEQPRLRPVRAAQAAGVSNRPQEDLLHEVIGIDPGRNAPRQESPQRRRERCPQGGGVGSDVDRFVSNTEHLASELLGPTA